MMSKPKKFVCLVRSSRKVERQKVLYLQAYEYASICSAYAQGVEMQKGKAMSEENVRQKKLVFEIPEDLHEKLKLYCIRNKTTITAEVTNLICGFLDGEAGAHSESEIEDEQGIPLKAERIEKPFDIDAFRKGLGLKSQKEEAEEIDIFFKSLDWS